MEMRERVYSFPPRDALSVAFKFLSIPFKRPGDFYAHSSATRHVKKPKTHEKEHLTDENCTFQKKDVYLQGIIFALAN